MKRCLTVINVNNVLCPNAAQSFAHAANRWDAEFTTITACNPDYHPTYCKHLCGKDLFAECAQLLISDADILIRSDAPNPFDLFNDPEKYYAVSNSQAHYFTQEQHSIEDEALVRWQGKLPLNFTRTHAHMVNTGFCLFKPETMRPTSDRFRSLLQGLQKDWRSHPHVEQFLWNCVLYEQNVPIHFLDETWNRLRPEYTVSMNRYVYHFTGYNVTPNFRAAIKTYNWRV
jgi:lipopolysaccharide biosynthesis glycosyltransferase